MILRKRPYTAPSIYFFYNLFQSLGNLKVRQPSMRQNSNAVFAASRTPSHLIERRQEKYHFSKQVSIFVITQHDTTTGWYVRFAK